MIRLALLLALLLPAAPARAEDLSAKLHELDAALFGAFNACDVEGFGALIDEDIEFYHDKTGLETSREAVIGSLETNICGKVRRELVEGSMEVYPVPGFGAIQYGEHIFFNRGEDGQWRGSDKVMKFLHIWKETDGRWTLTRIASYAH